jgi:hypothetical protein
MPGMRIKFDSEEQVNAHFNQVETELAGEYTHKMAEVRDWFRERMLWLYQERTKALASLGGTDDEEKEFQ